MKALLTFMALAFLIALPAHSELFFSVYGGTMYTHDADVHYKQNNGTDETFHDVSWDDKPFSDSPYGGYRLGYWFDRAPKWGISVEWIHGKMVADGAQNVSVSGTSAGVPVSGSQPLGSTFQNLEFTHGHNLFLLNVERRWLPGDDDSFLSRFEPYVGLGAGMARPHVEVRTSTSDEYDYEEAGFGCQGFAGVDFRLFKYFSLFAEYKLTYANIDSPIPNGSIEVDPISHHFDIGLTVHLGRPKH